MPPSIGGLLQEIVEVLKSSTIVEEKGKDVRPKFWAEYKKVSSEFDDNMLDWCNGNMDTILIFAGLFSGINTAFIMAMQPNPVDTTNALLVLLIQVMLNGPSAAQSTSLSSSTNYPSIFWMQVLAYMSLALSLLAAFGAVMGKQWLNFYKTHRYGNGSLEERCKQRHDKFQGLETWWFEGMLQTFSDLLKASLFLFGVSLAGWMWTLQRTISIFIILMTAFGSTCYVVAILVSVIYPNCPFQTRLSLTIRRFFYGNLWPKESFIVPAMDWMLKTSTYPDSVRAVLDLLSDMPSFKSDVGVKSLCKNVLHMFEACFLEDTPILEDALAYGTALIKFSMKYPQVICMLQDTTRWWKFWDLWHTVYLSRAVEECQISHGKMTRDFGDSSNRRHQANIRTTMHMVVPNDVGWIWSATFKPGRDLEEARDLGKARDLEKARNLEKVLMFNDITARFIHTEDFEAAGDAFILLSGFKNCDHSPSDLIPFLKYSGKLLHGALRGARAAFDNPEIKCDLTFRKTVLMAICPINGKDSQFINANRLLNFTEWPKDSHLAGSPLSDIQRMLLLVLPTPLLGNPAEYIPFCRTLIRYLRSNKSGDSNSKGVALRRACKLRQDLAMIDAEGVDPPTRDMVLSEFYPALLKVVHADWSDRNDYLRLIFALASSTSWLPRLHKDGLIKWCINISLELQKSPDPYSFYPAGILLRIQLAHPEHAALSTITDDRWWNMIKIAWRAASYKHPLVITDVIEIFEDLVTGTEMHMPNERDELQAFLGYLGSARANKQLGDHILWTGKKAKYEVDRLEREVHRKLAALPLPVPPPLPGPVTV